MTGEVLFGVLASLAVASLVVLAAGAGAVLAIREPARRIRAIQLAMGGLVILPMAALVPGYPRWPLVDALLDPPAQEGEVGEAGEIARTKAAADPREGSATPERHGASPTTAVSNPPAALPATSPRRPASPPAPRFGDFRSWLVGIYLFGVVGMAAWSAVGWLAVRRVLRAASPAGPRARNVLDDLAGTAGDRVRLVTSPLVSQPCAVGWRRPMIILPEGYEAIDERQLRWALAHEWSHVARGDLASWTASGLVGWVYFYQPLYWYLRRQLHVSQDFLADAAACRGNVPCAEVAGDAEAPTHDAADYAEFLVRSAAEAREPALAAGLGFGGRMSDLHRRIVMLVSRPIETASPRWWNAAALVCAVGLLTAAAMLVEGPLRSVAAQEAPAAKTDAAKSNAAKTAKTAKKPGKLGYNDGTGDDKRSLGGSGELVSFTLPDETAKVAGIRIHGSRYGLPQPPKEDFMIYFLNGDLSETVATEMAPYSLFKRGQQKWVDIKFKKPIEVPEDFSVCLDFRAQQTKGVYVSIDTSTDGTHSKIGLPGMEFRDADVGGDWMVEVVLAR